MTVSKNSSDGFVAMICAASGDRPSVLSARRACGRSRCVLVIFNPKEQFGRTAPLAYILESLFLRSARSFFVRSVLSEGDI